MNNEIELDKRRTFTTLVILSVIMLLVLLFTIPSEARVYSRNDIKKIIVQEALNSSVPPSLALAIAKIESDFNPNALSSAGARGIMQIMPRTARTEFGVKSSELWNARLNIQLGISYIERLYKQYGYDWDLALSHYNGGTLKGVGRYAKAHSYTRGYVRNVRSWQRRYKQQAIVWTASIQDGNTREGRSSKQDFYDFNSKEIKMRLADSLQNYKRLKAKRKILTTSTQPVFKGERLESEIFDAEFFKRLRILKRQRNLMVFPTSLDRG